MAKKKGMLITITLMFLGAGGLLYFLETVQVHQAGKMDLPFALWGVIIMSFLFFSVLALFSKECKKVTVEKNEHEKEVKRLIREQQVSQVEFDENVERRTFEISVINASLNREIAERMQAETSSRKLQRRMELILDYAGEGIFGLDSDGNVTFTNRAASDMLGWSPEELVGKSHHNLVHHTHNDGTPYDVKDCPIHKAYRDGMVHFSDDDVFWTKDGRSFHVEYISTPIMEKNRLAGAVIVFSDISTRLQVVQESRELQRQMELILDCAGEGIFGLDAKGNVTFTNKAAALMLGWSPEELVGKSHHDLVHHTHADGSRYPVLECPIYMAYKDGKVHFKSDDVFWCKDGTSFPVEYVSTPIEDDGNLTGAVVVFRNLTLPFHVRGSHDKHAA